MNHEPGQKIARPVGWWWWAVCPLALGSLALGAVAPVLLLPAALALIAISNLALRESRARASAQGELAAAGELAAREAHDAELLRGVFNSADIPVIATDERGELAQANHRARAVLGIGEAMLGRRFDELMTQAVLGELESLARRGEAGHARAAIPVRGEMRDFDVSADPVPISNGAVMTFRDITELSRAVTLKADFAANASHELRTPIASIKVAAETLAGPARYDEAMAGRLIEMIADNANRLEMLTADLLDLSRLEADDRAPEIAPVDPDELIGRVMGEFAAPGRRRGLTIVAEIEPWLGAVETDAALVMLILRNLVGNAVKFAREGTRIRIVAGARAIAPDRSALIPAGLSLPLGLRLEVIDRGIGIPLSHQQRVFERFYQVDGARAGSGANRGTGLGLAIVKHAAKRLGGTVSLGSVHQVGTTMTVDLPRCVAPPSGLELGASRTGAS